jgi:transcriptional regulator with XRE-family HTH domain
MLSDNVAYDMTSPSWQRFKKEPRQLRRRLLTIYGFVMHESSHPSEIFPERLRSARDRRGLNQGDLAKRSGLQASAISHFETGTRKPSFDNLRRLADALDVTTDFLLGRVKDLDGLAGADKLHRHYDRLTSDDRDVADNLMEMLAKKAESRARKGNT